MEKNKNKKKLFAIIGGSVLAFVLTIALSVSITLAYFGGNATGATSVKLSGSVYINDTDSVNEGTQLTMSAPVTNALPGETVSVTVDATLKSKGGQTAAVILLVEGTVTLPTLSEGQTAPWVANGTATYNGKTYNVYLYGTAEEMTPVTIADADGAEGEDGSVALTQFAASYKVSEGLDNDDALSTVASFNVVMFAVQNGIDSTTVTSPKSFESLKPIFVGVGTAGSLTFSA